MKQITMIETYDGQRHTDVLAAKKHLAALYADKLSVISHQIVAIGKLCWNW